MQEMTYDSAMNELQAIVNEVQSEQIGIDELSRKITRAAELIAFCREKLRLTEGELRLLFTDQGPA